MFTWYFLSLTITKQVGMDPLGLFEYTRENDTFNKPSNSVQRDFRITDAIQIF